MFSSSTEQEVFVGGVKILENANAKECYRAICDLLTKYAIHFDNVIALCTDSARYMTLCAETLKVPIPDFIHVQCWAYKLNLVASIWSSELSQLNKCVAHAKMAYLNTRKRKHRYLSFLKSKYPNEEKKAVLFPSPVMTRWNSWFKSALYVGEYLPDLVDFFKTMDEDSSAQIFSVNYRRRRLRYPGNGNVST